ncbi:hypothetical protein OVA11_19090 [Caulobacter sp. SL161]|uniref:hypothetical protein n=1 Tax=Caulobacter sp. SL161 TaxID=2995156 RepID=UPI0022740435|nr:hypothetical protein [Caulobacter sp. SL161]MCY1649084.1 hypothetical protein [Caulobacter sp. SL161]
MANWRENLELATARLAALEAAELDRFKGVQVKSVKYEVGGVEYADPVSMQELSRAIFEARSIVNRLGGGVVSGGAITPTFGA